jgi:cellulose synthase/poly-beta-1,6-N-acetylglucosamine synthase-like glycosyltransferase
MSVTMAEQLIDNHTEPVYFLDKCPEEFIEKFFPAQQSLQELEQDTSVSFGRLVEIAKSAQEQRWTEATGEEPGNSNFSVIYPIHNESQFLPSVLANLMMSDVPAAAHARFFFVTNACTDDGATEKIISQFMTDIGEVETCATNPELTKLDKGVDATYQSVRSGNIDFIHLNTMTKGRSNALSLGNESARSHAPIALCFDADVFSEPHIIYPGIVSPGAQNISMRSAVYLM